MSNCLPSISAFLEVDSRAIKEIQEVIRKDLSRGIKVSSERIVTKDKKNIGKSEDVEVIDLYNSSAGNQGFKNKLYERSSHHNSY